jgi:hypothetical protein
MVPAVRTADQGSSSFSERGAAAPPSGAPLYFRHRKEQEDRQHCDGAENQRDKISHCNLLKWDTQRLQSANSHL